MEKKLILCAVLCITVLILQGCAIREEAAYDDEVRADSVILDMHGFSKDSSGLSSVTGNAWKLSGKDSRINYLICKDSDSGKDYKRKGAVDVAYIIDGTQNSTTIEDSCEPEGLHEAYCSGQRLSISVYECPSGCEDGVCLGESGDKCDKDNLCNGQYVGYNYTCDSESGYDPEGNYICSCDMYCNPMMLRSACEESDKGFDKKTVGTVEKYSTKGVLDVYADFCINETALREFSCVNGVVLSEALHCEGECQKGACVPGSKKAPAKNDSLNNVSVKKEASLNSTIVNKTITCNDTDKGKDFYNKGIVTSFVVYVNKSLQISDTCILAQGYSEAVGISGNNTLVFNSVKECPNHRLNMGADIELGQCRISLYSDLRECTGKDCFVREVYCDKDGVHQFVEYNCVNGCYGGVCVAPKSNATANRSMQK